MKKLKFILLLTVLLTTFSCQSGKQKVQSKEEKSINEFVAHLTEVDTAVSYTHLTLPTICSV